jgi:hypothetical protein
MIVHVRRRALVAVLAALALGACSKGCGEELPDPDVCSGPTEGTVETAALGDGERDPFEAFAPGQVVRFIYTEEGDAALPLRFRLSGGTIPTCVEQRTTLLGCPAGEVCADEDLVEHGKLFAPLHTYRLDDGSGRETHVLYLRFERDNEPEEGARLELVSEIAGVDASVQLWFEVGGPDAQPDPSDAAAD